MSPDVPACPVEGCTGTPCPHMDQRRLVYVVPPSMATPPSPFPAAKKAPVKPKR